MDHAAVSVLGAPLRVGPWLWHPRLDLLLFAGSAVLALGLVALRHALGWPGDLPEWGFLLLIVGIDVAHVYSTLFRTYFDADELRRHPWRYALTPVAAYAAGLALYGADSTLFWSVLAYVAVFHFVRQQVGWVALYRARSEHRGPLDRFVDDGAVYAATLYPLVHWHAHLGAAQFHWFMSGDFLDIARRAQAILPVAHAAWVAALLAFALRQAQLCVQYRALQVGKCVVVLTTALLWYVGIVATNSDFDFTVTNVIAHGVPYIALTWAYGRARRTFTSRGFAARIVAAGPGLFVALLIALAFAEEYAWDRWVWLQRSRVFGEGTGVHESWLYWLVPLLALPQATHYALDGVLWRRSEAKENPAQRLALSGSRG